MRTPQVPVHHVPRSTTPATPSTREAAVRPVPQVLDLRQLKQVAGGYDLPNKGW